MTKPTKSLKFGNALLCEYVAKGDGGKHILVNVFSGDVLVGEIPAHLNFGFYIEYIVQEVGEISFQLEILLSKERLIALPVKVDRQRTGITPIVIQSIDFQIKEDKVLTVVASVEGYRRVTVLSKKLIFSPHVKVGDESMVRIVSTLAAPEVKQR